MANRIRALPLRAVQVTDGFWCARQRLMTDVTIPYMERILRDEVPGAEKSHALANFRMAAGEEKGEFYGMVFQDSDVAKWLEAAAYSLALKPDEGLKKRVDDVIALIGRAQQPDGYLNTYFTVKEPQSRWVNLLECHELYCAGHMMEAACAFHETLGEDRLLSVAERLADHIIDRFGEGKTEGIPGHQEIEIGLMRMFHVTGKAAYRDMAMRFLNLRGQDPRYFATHTPPHPDVRYGGYTIDPNDNRYNQSDMPVREQTKARGHAVRQVYMLAAMADAAAAAGDKGLREACERLFGNITERQMYVTGAIGSSARHETFTADFDLPNDRVYGETCAAVAMAFFAQRMLQLEPDGRYADLLERELYNGALAGMQLDGQRFFYVNPLEVTPGISGVVPGYEHALAQRPNWHACACCPPNLARLIASLGKFLWSEDETAVYSHLFVGSAAHTRHAVIELETGYPWQGNAVYTLTGSRSKAFTLAIHIPGYLKSFRVAINGERADAPVLRGYCHIKRTWQSDDRVEVAFDLAPRRIYADPRVRDDAGKVALARGPIIYCFEDADNGDCLSALRLPRASAPREMPYDASLLDGVIALEADGLRAQTGDTLYSGDAPAETPVTLRAIPYYAWGNRGVNPMSVWIRE